jgi:hypothetical protein
MAINENQKAKPHAKRRHSWAFPLGLGIVALAIVGAITLVSFGINSVKKLTDKTALKTEYGIFVQNVIRNDPYPFDDISKANMSQLLDSAIWELIGNGKMEADKYEYSDTDPIGYRVPVKEVDFNFVKLFGSEISPLHDTILGSGYTFYFDTVTQEYTIPVTGISPIYMPQVYTIDKQGSSIILTVGFVGYGEWDMDELGWAIDPVPVKFMKITLRERSSTNKDIPEYYVGALQAAEEPDEATTDEEETDTTKAVTTQAVTTQTIETTGTDETTQTDETSESGDVTTVVQTDETTQTDD